MNSFKKVFLFTTSGATTLYFSKKYYHNELFRMGLAGIFIQTATDVLFHPIELINVNTKFNFNDKISTINQLKEIHAKYTYRGFFKGMSVCIYNGIWSGFVYFIVYKYFKENILDKISDSRLNFIAYSLSAMFSEIFSTIITQPFNLVRTRMETNQYDYKGFLDAMWKMKKMNPNFYNYIQELSAGFNALLALNVVTTTLAFVTFECLRDLLAYLRNIKVRELSSLDYSLCTLLAGFTSASATNSLEVFLVHKQIFGSKVTLKNFLMKENSFALKSGLLGRNIYVGFYTIVLLQSAKIFGNLFDVEL